VLGELNSQTVNRQPRATRTRLFYVGCEDRLAARFNAKITCPKFRVKRLNSLEPDA
jgi:hypothetical protein